MFDDELFEYDEKELRKAIMGCRHVLFEEELDYLVCPSCGKLIEKNLPEDEADQGLVYQLETEVSHSLPYIFYRCVVFCLFISVLYLPVLLEKIILEQGGFEFYAFMITERRQHSIIELFTLWPFLLLIFFLGWGEKGRRNLLVSLKLESFYQLHSTYFMRAIYVGVVALSVYYLQRPFIQDDAKYAVARVIARGFQLSQEERFQAEQAFIQIIHLSLLIFSLELLLYQFAVTAKARRIMTINEDFLYHYHY